MCAVCRCRTRCKDGLCLTKKAVSLFFSEGQYGTETQPCLGYMLRTSRFKLLVRGSMERAMLFDLEQDPFEMENVAEHPDYLETKKELQKS